MTNKKKIELVAAQFGAYARDQARKADALDRVALALDEDGAGVVLKKLEELGLIDAEGLLTDRGDASLIFRGATGQAS